MSKKIVIFGVSDFAELANYYLKNDSNYEVSAFCVSHEFMPPSGEFCGLPVVEFNSIEMAYPSKNFKFFAPMAPKKMNRTRENIFLEIKNKGYDFISYVSSAATVLTDNIGENCFILEDNTIQPFVEIGDNCVLWSGNHIGHHSKVDDSVTITSHVVISGHCTVGRYCFLGVNSTISNKINLAEGTLVSMATSIEGNTDPWSVYKGNPAIKLSMPSNRIRI